jgi:hypothetical protein
MRSMMQSVSRAAICRSRPPGCCRLNGRQYPAATLDEVKPPRPSAGSRHFRSSTATIRPSSRGN